MKSGAPEGTVDTSYDDALVGSPVAPEGEEDHSYDDALQIHVAKPDQKTLPNGQPATGAPWEESIRQAYRGPTDSHTLPGLAELAATGVANIPAAAGNAVIDLVSRAIGKGTENNHVIPEFSPGEAGREVISDISNSDEGKAVARGAAKADRWVGNTFGATTQDVLHQAGSVAGDVLNLIPAASAASRVAGPVVRWAKDIPTGEGTLTPETPYAEPEGAPAVAPTGSRQSIGAAQAPSNPFTLTGQETARGTAFPQIKLSKNAGDVAPEEQATRAGIVKEILDDAGEDSGIRTGVVTGNEQTLRSEYSAAKRADQSPANDVFAQQIASEQRALPKFAQQRVDATGADPTLTNDTQRGEVMNGALYGANEDAPGEGSLTDYLKQQKQKIFQAAHDSTGSLPHTSTNFDALLSDPQFQAGAEGAGMKDVVGAASKFGDLARTVGFRDPVSGARYAPGSVSAWQAVTKAMNGMYTPDRARLIKMINGAINDDMDASGGGPLFRLGNKIHELQHSLLTDSKGISTVFGDVDANGVQTAKPFDSIPKALNNLPIDQWRHIHDIFDMLSRGQIRGAPDGLDPVPASVRMAAARAKAEMHGALAREVYNAGGGGAAEWIPNAANETLNGRVGQKIVDTFPPDEVRKYQVLDAGGQMMPGRHPYEGAAAQKERMDQDAGIVERYAPAAGAFLGAKGATTWTVAGGEYLGQKVKGWTKARREAANARAVTDALRRNRDLAGGPPPVIGRASGGRVDHEALVNQLMNRWHAARRDANRHTEPLLKMTDDAVANALKLAQRQAMP